MKKWLPAVGFVVILLTWFFYPKLAAWLNPDLMARGQYGDMYGGLNTLFSGLAFAGLIYTVILQREELGLQRLELQLTREELKRTAEANIQSAAAMAEQVKNQLLAARISGLSGLLASYDTSFSTSWARGVSPKNDVQNQRESCRNELHALLTALKTNAA